MLTSRKVSRTQVSRFPNIRTPSYFQGFKGPYTKVHTPSYFLGFKGPYDNLSLYRKKTKIVNFFGYLYKKKPFELPNIRTPIHLYTNSFGLMTSLTSLKPKTYTTLGSLAKYFLCLYSKKTRNIHFFLLTYIRKNSFELANTRTPIHPYTKSFGLVTSLTH